MTLLSAIRDYVSYNQWANKELTNWLRTLDESMLYEEMKSSFPSIEQTLQHMNSAQNFWLAVLTGASIDLLEEKSRTGDAAGVIGDLLNSSLELVNFASTLDEYSLLSTVSPPGLTKTRFEFLLHAVNHNTHHRGQVITMIRMLNITENIPNTDYDTYLLHKAPTASQLKP